MAQLTEVLNHNLFKDVLSNFTQSIDEIRKKDEILYKLIEYYESFGYIIDFSYLRKLRGFVLEIYEDLMYNDDLLEDYKNKIKKYHQEMGLVIEHSLKLKGNPNQYLHYIGDRIFTLCMIEFLNKL